MTSRIVFIHEFAHAKGGASASMLDLARLLSSDEPVLVITPESGEMESAVTAAGGAHVGIAPALWQVGFSRPLASLLNLFRLQSAIRKHLREGDVLVVNGILGEFIVGWGWRLSHFPRIYFVRGAVGTSKLWNLMSLRGLRVVVAVSRYAKDEFMGQFPGFQGRLAVIPNAVEVPERAAKPLEAHPFRIGVVGFIHPQKNHALAIKALALLRSSGVDAELHIYGDAASSADEAYMQELISLVRITRLEDHVSFHGRATREQIYANIHVLVSASLTEGFGKTIAEAMANGLPAIALERAGGPRDIILDPKEGILLADDTPEALAGALRRLAASPALRTEMGHAARDAVSQRFAPGIVVTKVKEAIQSARSTT